MEMETLPHSNTSTILDLVASLVVETALCAHKSLLCLHLLIGSQSNGRNMLTSLMEADQRFPFADLTSVREPVAENNDAGETEVTESSDDDEEDNEEEDNESEEEESDDGEDSDGDAEANGDSESDEEDDNNDEDDDSDDEEEDDDNDDSEDDEEEEEQPPSKKKK